MGLPVEQKLAYAIHIKFMNLPVIAGIQSGRHALDDAFAPVAQDHHLAGLLVEVEAFHLARAAKFSEGLDSHRLA